MIDRYVNKINQTTFNDFSLLFEMSSKPVIIVKADTFEILNINRIALTYFKSYNNINYNPDSFIYYLKEFLIREDYCNHDFEFITKSVSANIAVVENVKLIIIMLNLEIKNEEKYILLENLQSYVKKESKLLFDQVNEYNRKTFTNLQETSKLLDDERKIQNV